MFRPTQNQKFAQRQRAHAEELQKEKTERKGTGSEKRERDGQKKTRRKRDRKEGNETMRKRQVRKGERTKGCTEKTHRGNLKCLALQSPTRTR
jgi:hypothetical protein